MQTSDQINELAAALAKAQGDIRSAERNATNPYFRSRYADLGAVWDACRAPLSAAGLAVTQATETIPEPGPVTRMVDKKPVQFSNTIRVEVTTTLLHASGQWIRSVLRVLPDGDRAQDVAAAAGFAKRVALASLVGVPQEAEDDAGGEQEQQQRQRRPAPPPRLGPPAKREPERAAAPASPTEQQSIEGWLTLIDAAVTLDQLDEVAKNISLAHPTGADGKPNVVAAAARGPWAKKRVALQHVAAEARAIGAAAEARGANAA